MESTIPLLPKSENFKLLAIFFGSTARFVLDLVGNPEDRFLTPRLKLILKIGIKGYNVGRFSGHFFLFCGFFVIVVDISFDQVPDVETIQDQC